MMTIRVEVNDDVTDSWVTHWKGVEIPPAPRYVDTGELILLGDLIEFDYFGRKERTVIKELSIVHNTQKETVETWISPLHYPGLIIYPGDVTFIDRTPRTLGNSREMEKERDV